MCPGRSAARSGALQTRDRPKLGACRPKLGVRGGPGSAVHHNTHAVKLAQIT